MRKILVAVGIGLVLSALFITFNVVMAHSATNVNCKTASDTHNFGSFWPGDQYVTDHTNWCYGINSNNVRVITSISHTVTGHGDQVGGLCEFTGQKHWQIASGTNYREWQDEATFKCETNIPNVYVYRTDDMQLWVDAEGQYCGPDYCPCSKDNSCGK